MKLTLRSSVVWLCFLIIAFMNGAFREFVIIHRLGVEHGLANQISCLTGATLWTILLLFLWRMLEIKKFKQATTIGTSWLLATAIFETFVINRNLTWNEIGHTYNFSAGEYWGIVLLWLGILPTVILCLQHLYFRIRE
jgi:hypothetical protein